MSDDDIDRRDLITFREAVSMFVGKAEFDKFTTRVEAKLDSLLANQLPKWAWVVLGILVSIIAPIFATFVAHWLDTVWKASP